MKILVAGVANTIETYRDDPDLTMELAIVDPSDGEDLATPVVTNDATDITISGAISQGDTSFDAIGTVYKGLDYIIRHDPVDLGPEQRITIIAHDAAARVMTLKYPFMYNMAADCHCLGIRSSASYTPTSAYAGKELWIEWTDSDGVKSRETYLVVAFELKCPITSDDVRDRWPRAKLSGIPTWQQVTQVGWQPQIDDAWDELRDEFYSNGLLLDRVVSASLLKPVTFALIEKRLINMGLDPSRSGEDLRESQNRVGKKVAQLMAKAFGLPLQKDLNDDNKNTGDAYKRGLTTTIYRNS